MPSSIARRVRPSTAPLAVLLALAGPLLLALSVPARAHEFTAGEMTVLHPSAPPTPPGVSSAAGYLVLVNEGDEADRLLGGDAAPFARGVEIHRTTVQDDVARMRRLDDGLEIPAGATVRLDPGGTHLMFTGLVEPLTDGEPRRVVLVFERAGPVDVEFAIERPATGGSATSGSAAGGATDEDDVEHGDMDHGDSDHGGTDHGGMDHGGMDHGGMDHGDVDGTGTNRDGGAGHDGTDHGGEHDGASREGSADDEESETLDVK